MENNFNKSNIIEEKFDEFKNDFESIVEKNNNWILSIKNLEILNKTIKLDIEKREKKYQDQLIILKNKKKEIFEFQNLEKKKNKRSIINFKKSNF